MGHDVVDDPCDGARGDDAAAGWRDGVRRSRNRARRWSRARMRWRDAYDLAMREFLARTERAMAREGLDYLRLTTGEPLEPALRRFLVRASRQCVGDERPVAAAGRVVGPRRARRADSHSPARAAGEPPSPVSFAAISARHTGRVVAPPVDLRLAAARAPSADSRGGCRGAGRAGLSDRHAPRGVARSHGPRDCRGAAAG